MAEFLSYTTRAYKQNGQEPPPNVVDNIYYQLRMKVLDELIKVIGTNETIIQFFEYEETATVDFNIIEYTVTIRYEPVITEFQKYKIMPVPIEMEQAEIEQELQNILKYYDAKYRTYFPWLYLQQNFGWVNGTMKWIKFKLTNFINWLDYKSFGDFNNVREG